MLMAQRAGLIAAAAALAMPGHAESQTFGQILESEIPLDAIGAPLNGVRDRSRPELQPLPLQIGPIALSAGLDTTLGATSNVLGTPGSRQADGFVEWLPHGVAAVDLGADRSAQVRLDYAGKRFLATPAKRQDGHYAGVTGQTGFGRDGVLFAAAFHQRIYEDQLAGSFPANGGGSVAIDQTHAQARLAQAFNRVTLTGALTFDRLLYHDTLTTTGALLRQSDRNDSILRASSRIDYTLLANTTLFAQVSWRDTVFAENSAYSDRSSHELRMIGGFSADVSGLIRVSAGLGSWRRQYRAPAAGASSPDFNPIAGLAWDLRGVYYLSALTTLSLQSKREYVDVNIRKSPGYEASSLQMQLDHEFLRNLLLSASFGRESDRFRLVTRQDHLWDIALWADYWLSSHLLVKPRIAWLDRTGAGLQIPEIRTQLTLSVRN